MGVASQPGRHQRAHESIADEQADMAHDRPWEALATTRASLPRPGDRDDRRVERAILAGHAACHDPRPHLERGVRVEDAAQHPGRRVRYADSHAVAAPRLELEPVRGHGRDRAADGGQQHPEAAHLPRAVVASLLSNEDVVADAEVRGADLRAAPDDGDPDGLDRPAPAIGCDERDGAALDGLDGREAGGDARGTRSDEPGPAPRSIIRPAARSDEPGLAP